MEAQRHQFGNFISIEGVSNVCDALDLHAKGKGEKKQLKPHECFAMLANNRADS